MDSIPPERWQRIDDLFGEVLDQPPAERMAYLEEACAGDTELFAAVRALLERSAKAEQMIGESATQFAPELLSSLEAGLEEGGTAQISAGSRIGPYRIVEELGRGGMGTVYLAERADGEFDKRVALKLVKRGMDSDEIVRRFRHERQILATLDHANIAMLLDGGVSDDGRPYLVMEYVEGEPLDTFCDRRRLGVAARLALFETVCEAVQYAHQKLVVHRDLKPSNILVTAAGQVKLLDFGIAKLLDPEADPDAPHTRTSFRLLTPDYASPEQLLGTPVTVATDVYTLGLLLYQLLTGRPPFPGSARSDLEASLTSRDRGPKRPSTAVLGRPESQEPDAKETDPSGASISAARATTPQRLRRELRGDLDNILLKALEAEPARRYASAEQLLEDIRRHRTGLPIRARPATLKYRAAKFVRRYRLETAGAALFTILLSGSVVALALQGAETARQRDRAEQELVKADQVTQFMIEMFGASDPSESRGEELTAREVLDRGAARVHTELADQPEVQASLLQTISLVYLTLGLPDQAVPLAEEAMDLRSRHLGEMHPDVADSRNALASALQGTGDYDAAEPLYRSALEIRTRLLGPRHPDVVQSQLNLGLLLTYSGDYGEAEPLLRQALATDRELHGDVHADVASDLNNLAVLLYYKGDYAGAEAAFREALDVRRQVFGDPHPRVATTLNNLAAVVQRQGDLVEAEALHRENLRMARQLYGDRHPDVASALSNLASLLNARGEPTAAEPLLRESLEIGREMLGDHPEVADATMNLATTLVSLRRLEEAESLLHEALAINRARRGPQHPRTGLTLYHLASLELARGGCAAALPLYREALDVQEASLPEGHDETEGTRAALASCQAGP